MITVLSVLVGTGTLGFLKNNASPIARASATTEAATIATIWPADNPLLEFLKNLLPVEVVVSPLLVISLVVPFAKLINNYLSSAINIELSKS